MRESAAARRKILDRVNNAIRRASFRRESQQVYKVRIIDKAKGREGEIETTAVSEEEAIRNAIVQIAKGLNISLPRFFEKLKREKKYEFLPEIQEVEQLENVVEEIQEPIKKKTEEQVLEQKILFDDLEQKPWIKFRGKSDIKVKSMRDKVRKRIAACEILIPVNLSKPLSNEEIETYYEKLGERWALKDSAPGIHDHLYRKEEFDDRTSMINFLNALFTLKDNVPELRIYNNVVEITIGSMPKEGMTSDDFALAEEIDQLRRPIEAETTAIMVIE